MQTDPESSYYLEMMEHFRANKHGSFITMVVFQGGKGARQLERCKVALQNLRRDLRIERNIQLDIKYLDQDEVKNIEKWGPAELTDYLLTFDIHLCITHPHQGNVNKTTFWNIRNIYRHVDRWSFHLGFFSGRYCRCPVLTQNKRVYIEAAPEICMRSAFVKMPKPGSALTEDQVRDIKNFVDYIGPLYNNKFCVKLPFVTNRRPKYGVGLEGVLKCLNEYMRQDETVGYYPYIIVQPRLTNNIELFTLFVFKLSCFIINDSLNFRLYSPEIKIACFNGIAKFKCSKPRGGGRNSIPGFNDHDLKAFAEKAIAVLKAKLPFFFMDQLVRVDIFYDPVRRSLVVNEFESLEAVVGCNHGTCEGDIQNDIEQYWYTTGLELVQFHLWRKSLAL